MIVPRRSRDKVLERGSSIWGWDACGGGGGSLGLVVVRGRALREWWLLGAWRGKRGWGWAG